MLGHTSISEQPVAAVNPPAAPPVPVAADIDAPILLVRFAKMGIR